MVKGSRTGAALDHVYDRIWLLNAERIFHLVEKAALGWLR